MAQGGNTTGAGGPKNIARATRKVRVPKVKATAGKAVASARAQERAFASQGASVEKSASRQKAAARTRQREVKDTKGAADLGRARDQVVVRDGRVFTFKPAKRGLSVKGRPAGSLVTVDKGRERGMTVEEANPDRTTLSKLLVAEGGDVTPGKVARNALRDVVSIPAETVPSLYKVGKTAATGHLAEAGKMLAEPYIEAAKHPKESFGQHPLGTLLLAAGPKHVAGRGAGAAMRALPSTATRRLASTERAALTVPGTRIHEQRHYSPDVFRKGEQVAVDRVRARRAASRGEVPTQLPEKGIGRRVDADVQAAKNITQGRQERTARAARKAVGRKPTAATNLVTQGITAASHEDLHAYLIELEREARTLTGEDRKLNGHLQDQIHDALKRHDGPRVQAGAQAYSEHAAPLNQRVVDLGLVKPDVAEATRLAPVAIRRLGASSEAKRAARATAKQQRTQADRTKRAAGKTVVKAEQDLAQARANARVSIARRKQSPALRAAEKQRTQAVADLARLRRQQRGRPYTVEAAAQVKGARDAARAADRAVTAERQRIRGVAPAEHDALMSALATRDQARVARTQARTEAKAATAAHREIKKAAYVDAEGKPITIPNVRAAMGRDALEPAFVSHADVNVRGAALPVEPVSIPVKQNRTGEAVRKGTLDASPDALVRQSVNTQALIDATEARGKFIDDWGHRAKHDAPVETYRTQALADNAARGVAEETGVQWSTLRQQDGSYVLVPRSAKGRLVEHEQPKSAPLGKVSARWRRNVLGFSPKWFTSNHVEAAVRSLVGRSGPRSYIQGRRALTALERIDPKAAEQLRARAIGRGGQSGMVAATAREAMSSQRVAGTKLAGIARAVGQMRGPRDVSKLYAAYTDFVFNTLNGGIESQFRTAMLGKALRDSPLMKANTVKLSRRAVDEAAQGLRDTNAQVALAREVDRMYGQYDKFSPDLQAAIVQYTPFAAWTLNAIKFLGVVLPHDHPVLTSVIASANDATEQWRRQHGLDFFASGAAPGWLQGSIPGAGGSHLRLSRYTPFGLAANEGGPLGALPGLLLPQFSESLQNFAGRNWQYKPLSRNSNDMGRNAIAAVASFLEGQIPAASQIISVTGVRTPNMADSTKVKPTVGARARSQFDPFMFTPGASPTAGGGSSVGVVNVKPIKVQAVKVKPIKVKPITVR